MSASQWVDLGLIISTHRPKTLETVSTASLLGACQEKDGAEKKLSSSTVVSLGASLGGAPPSLRGRQMIGTGNLPFAATQFIQNLINRT